MWKFCQNDNVCGIVPKQVWSLTYLCAVLRQYKKGQIQKGPHLFHNMTRQVSSFITFPAPWMLMGLA